MSTPKKTGIAQWIREQLRLNPALDIDTVRKYWPHYQNTPRDRLTLSAYISRERIHLNLPPRYGKLSAEAPVEILKKPSAEKKEEDTPYEEEKEVKDNAYWFNQYRQARRKVETALRDAVVADRLCALAKELAPRSYETAPFCHVRTHSAAHGAPQSAFLMLSDTHVGQVVTPEQTLGFGGYSFEMFMARLRLVEEFVIRQSEDHNSRNLTEELFIAMLGDMIHGALNHSSEADQHTTLFSQFYAAGHVLAQFLRNLSAHFKKIRVETTVGNHPRWGTQKKMPTVNRYSNLDQFLYAYVASLVRDIENIEFPLHCEPFRIVEVQGIMFHLAHGDHLRGGDKALGIPNHSVARQIAATTQLYSRRGDRTPDCYCVGHFHRPIDIPHAKGKFLFNGGFPGLDGYALDGNFNPVEPSQVFFFVHPEYGMHSRSDIQLWRADPKVQEMYALPEGLQEQFPIK